VRSENRFDVCYRPEGPSIDYHFCREWDSDGGCYGTNPDHGFTWEQAKQEIISWHQQQIDHWKALSESDWDGTADEANDGQ